MARRKDRRHDLADLLIRAMRTRPPATPLDLDLDDDEPAPAISIKSQRTAAQSSTKASTATSARSPSSMTLAAWQARFTLNLEMFPDSRKSTAGVDMTAFAILDVFEDGTVVGAYETPREAYMVYVGMQMPPSACSCRDSNGEYACNHCYAFTKRVIEELGRDSHLATRVRDKQLSAGSPDWEEFRYDDTAESLRQLMRIATSVKGPRIELPSVDALRRERLAWNISERYGSSPRLQAVVQPLNKRGDGWNKGKETTSNSLNPAVERTEADELAFALYNRDTPYTTGSLENVAKVLKLLVGQSNVYFGGEPIEIAHGSGGLRLVRHDEGWQVEPNPEPGQNQCEFKFVRDGVLNIDRSVPRIYVTETSDSQLRCMQGLTDLPPVKKLQQVRLLVAQCKRLQGIVNLSLPEAFGRVVDNPAKPVMLLRSRADGFLDYGIRMRDSEGGLNLPAGGSMFSFVDRDGEAFQLKRSFADEQRTVRELQHQLQLPANEITGRLTFEQGLHLVELLEKERNDVEVLWEADSQPAVRSLGTLGTKNVRVSINQKRDWFQLDGVCELDGAGGSIKLSELMGTLSDGTAAGPSGYVRIGDHGFAKLTDELRAGLKKLADTVNHERGQMKFDRTAAKAIRDIGGELQIQSTKSWQDCLDRLAVAETLEPEVPSTLQADLRDYQVAGFKWMRRLAEWGVGGVLADDMGLGKTVQTLAVLVDRAEHGPTLVIAPTSVGFNWLREAGRFAPHLQAHSYRDTDRGDFLNELGPGHIVVCSYGLALRDAEKLAQVTWSSMVLDEAQAIKNSNSKTSQAIASIPSDWTIALTGTPVENHLGELWSLFRIVSPGLFGGWDQFRNRFANPIERDNDDDRRLALRERLKPFVLRRTKREVLRDLPARTESNIVIELTAAERKVYDQTRLSVIGEANEIAKLSDTKDQRFKLLALLTRLRQIACHPGLVDERWTERSTKLLQLQETIQQLSSEGHRALIFSQFVQHLKLIREMFEAEGITYQYLDGSTSPEGRQQEVDRFQNGDATTFLISLKAGGTGLNLTAADYVIHMDPWWNPAVEDQATDRAHRIGQTKPVMVYRLIAKNTIEEEILRLHEDKRDLVAGILDGTHAASSLSTKELIDLLTRQEG